MSQTLASRPQAGTRTTWTVDPAHTVAEFAVKHLMIATVKGRFGTVRGTLRLDEEQPTRSAVEIEIDAASIDTREEKRDEHLRSADFFDVAKYPTITFRSTRIEAAGADTYRVTGGLTMRGVTREVVLELEDAGSAVDPWGNPRRAFTARTRLDRHDFGLTWNQALETGGVLVGREVKVEVDVQFVKQAE